MAISYRKISGALNTRKLTGKAALNLAASLLDYGARITVAFIINPLLLTGLGNTGYGLWQVLGRLIGYAKAADGRPSQALKWTIANKQVVAGEDEKRRYVGSAISIWLLFLPLMTTLGALLSWYAPIWLDVSTEYIILARIAAGLLVVDLILRSLLDVPLSVLTGENLGYKRMGLSALLVFVGGGLTATALYFDAGLVGVAAASVATSLLGGLLFLRVTFVHVDWFGIQRPALDEIWKFGRLSGWFLLWNVVMRILRASDVVLLGILGSVELVTVYTLTKYLPETIIDLVAILSLAAAPGLGGIIGSGDFKKAVRLRSELMTITWLITTVAGTTILLWNHSFVQLWVGAQYSAGQVPTLLIVLMAMQFAFIRNDSQIIDLTLDLRRKVLVGLFSAVLSLAIVCVFVGILDMGIPGLCLSYIIGRSVMSFQYPLFVGRYLDHSLLIQIKSIMRPAIISCVLLGLASLNKLLLVANTWIEFVCWSLITAIIVLIFTPFAGLSSGQRSLVLRRIRGLKDVFNTVPELPQKRSYEK